MAAAAIKSAERVLAIFEHFRRTRRPAGASEIGRALELPQSSTSMLLRNLVQLGYLDYAAEARTYLPTLRIALLGDWIHQADPQTAPLADVLSHIQQATCETVILGRQNGPHAQYLSVLQQEYGVQLTVKAGMLRPMTVTAIGQALLASKPDDEVRKIIRRNNAEAAAPNLRVSEREFLEHLEQVRRIGYARTVCSVVTEGASIIAMLLLLPTGAPLAVGVGGPGARIDDNVEPIISTLRAHIAELGAAIHHHRD